METHTSSPAQSRSSQERSIGPARQAASGFPPSISTMHSVPVGHCGSSSQLLAGTHSESPEGNCMTHAWLRSAQAAMSVSEHTLMGSGTHLGGVPGTHTVPSPLAPHWRCSHVLGTMHLARERPTTHTVPPVHSRSEQDCGGCSTQRTTGLRSSPRSRKRHSNPSGQGSISAQLWGRSSRHLARGPRFVRTTTQVRPGCWQKPGVHSVASGGKTHRVYRYCLHLESPGKQRLGTASSMHIRPPGHTLSSQVPVRDGQTAVTFLRPRRKKSAVHDPPQKFARHSALRKRGHLAVRHGSTRHMTGSGQSSSWHCTTMTAADTSRNASTSFVFIAISLNKISFLSICTFIDIVSTISL